MSSVCFVIICNYYRCVRHHRVAFRYVLIVIWFHCRTIIAKHWLTAPVPSRYIDSYRQLPNRQILDIFSPKARLTILWNYLFIVSLTNSFPLKTITTYIDADGLRVVYIAKNLRISDFRYKGLKCLWWNITKVHVVKSNIWISSTLVNISTSHNAV